MGGPVRKPFLELLGQPVIAHTLRRFHGIEGLEQILVVAHPDDMPRLREAEWPRLRALGATDLVAGGLRRQDSVANALSAVRPGIEIVLIHDSVRPFVPRRAIEESIEVAARHGAALVAMPLADTVKRSREQCAVETVPREDLWAAQTPQTFRIDLVRRAYAQAESDGIDSTDDAQLVERLGVPVPLVRGSYRNFKLTTPEHLHMAEALLARGETE